MVEIKPAVTERFEFEYRYKSLSIAHLAVSGLSGI